MSWVWACPYFREETLCAIHQKCEVTCTFSRGRICFFTCRMSGVWPHLQVTATEGFAIPSCDNLWSDSLQSYHIDRPHSACHPLSGTRLDVYTRSIQKLMLPSYVTHTDRMVTCMMTDSSSESEDNLFLLSAFALSFNFAQSKANEGRSHSNWRVHHFWLTFSLSGDLFCLCADCPGKLSTHRKYNVF